MIAEVLGVIAVAITLSRRKPFSTMSPPCFFFFKQTDLSLKPPKRLLFEFHWLELGLKPLPALISGKKNINYHNYFRQINIHLQEGINPS